MFGTEILCAISMDSSVPFYIIIEIHFNFLMYYIK